jgi:ABC-2 type transport system permease protein
MSSLSVLIKKECTEDILSSRSIYFFLFASGLMSIFAVLLITNRELSLLDNAQAVYKMSTIVLALASLVAILQGSDGFAGERDRETLEILFLSPLSRKGLAFAKLGRVLFSWLVLFALSIPYLSAVGSTGQNLWPSIYILFTTGTLLVLALGGISLTVSARTATLKSALFISVIVFLILGSPAVLGASLRQTGIGKIIDMVDPFMDALNTIDSVVIDSQGFDFQLLRLGIMALYALMVLWLLNVTSRRIRL